MAELFNIQHEVDLSEYDLLVTDGGDLSQGTPGLAGTTGRMECLIDDTTSMYARKYLSVSNIFRCRFYFDPNTITMGDGDVTVVNRYAQRAGAWLLIAQVYLRYTIAEGYRITVTAYNDAGGFEVYETVDITDEPHYIEYQLTKAASDVSDDGTYNWWLDGVQQNLTEDIDNYNIMTDEVLTNTLGAQGPSAGIDGTIYLDELKANDDGSEIGPVGIYQAVNGVLTPVGTIVKNTGKLLVGSLTPIGLISKITNKTFTGSTTLVGNLINQTQKAFTGATTASGVLVKRTGKITIGSITASGVLIRSSVKSFSGSLTASGVLGTVKAALKSIGGSLTPSGTLVRQTGKILLGSVTATGSIVKQTAKAVIGSVTAVGSLATQKIAGGYYQVVGGAVTMAGLLVRQTNKQTAGTLASVGTLIKQTSIAITGVVTAAGSLVKQTAKSLVGAVTVVGTLVSQLTFIQLVNGVMTMTGVLTRQTSKQTAGIVTMAGSITKHITKTFSGVLTAVGTLARQILGLPVPETRIYAIESENRVYAIT